MIKAWAIDKGIRIGSYLLLGLFCFIVIVVASFMSSVDEDESDDVDEVLCRPKGSPLTAKELDGKLKGKGVLDNQGSTIINAGEKYGVDPVLITAIILQETAHGTSNSIRTKNNPGGLMGRDGLMSFPTLEKGINKMASVLYRLYIKEGLTTPADIGPRYAPVGAKNDPDGLNRHWISNVTQNVKILGGLSYDCKQTTTSAGSLKNISDASKYPYKHASPSGVDRWAFYNRQCTSFVAWRLNDMGVKFHNHMKGGRFSHAKKWADNARRLGYKVNKTAKPGAVAQWDAGAYGHSQWGHVAFVVDVKGDQITIEEYNRKPYAFSSRTIPASQVSNYIHFK